MSSFISVKNKKNKKDLWSITIGAVLLIAIILIIKIRDKNRADKVSNDHAILNGVKVYKCFSHDRVAALRYQLQYNFTYNEKEYYGTRRGKSLGISVRDCEEHFCDRYFPVLIQPDDPKNNSILILPEDFSKYGYAFPDSLSWVLQYLEKQD